MLCNNEAKKRRMSQREGVKILIKHQNRDSNERENCKEIKREINNINT